MPASCTHGTCAQLWLRVNLERGPGELTIPLEQQFSEIASYIALVIEAGAVLVVAFGAAQALIGVAAAVHPEIRRQRRIAVPHYRLSTPHGRAANAGAQFEVPRALR